MVIYARYLVLFLFLSACSTVDPSKAITENAVKGLTDIEKSIERIESQTKKECLTEALIANLEALKSQTKIISGQVESISMSCQTEKQVLEEQKTVREVLIGLLGFIVLLLGYKLIKR